MPIERQLQEDIHRRLLAGDALASDEVCEHLLEPLTHFLRSRVASSVKDDAVLADAAIDALMEYITRPDRFDPGRGKSLYGYLCMSARGDLLNSMKSIQRRAGREVSLDVEEDEGSWNIDIEDTQTLDGLEEALLKENAEEWQGWIRSIISDPMEIKVVSMMAEGEKRTEVFADVMGLQDLPLPEQRQRVKQMKDRLVKRLRRTHERER